ncbi:zinc finger BED domain-containing protein 1-like [Formica exsecta]|uniref:zinc finger BED domain-containing protein 1-like n=1 Tax=Formica exsecta TaxID=72781 RepID=UPI0011435166|nr:zinc finger BED domain-containing protein 1-like [Formica exsecta]
MTDETVPAVKVAQSTITPRIVHKSNVPAINEINSNKSTRKRSSVWMYFDKKDDQHALCTICNFKVKHCGGTSNLQAHLTRSHGPLCSGIFNNKRIISESENEKVATPNDPSPKRKKFSLMNKFSRIDEAFQKANSFAEGGSHSDKITAALMFTITKDKEPLAMVEREGFRHFMKVIVPLYRIPDRKTVT